MSNLSIQLAAAWGGSMQGVLVLAALTGAMLLARGLRGRLLHQRPTCRKCKFDLSGNAAGASVCPECGSDLTKPRAIRVGVRRKHWLTIVAGMFFLVLSVGGGLVFTLTRGNVTVNTYKPAWMLASEAKGFDTRRASAALDELIVRAGAKKLSPELTTKLVDEAIRQQTSSLLWLPQWGDIVSDARRAGLVDDQKWITFLRQGISIKVIVRPRVRQGENTNVSIQASSPMIGGASLWFRYHLSSLTIDQTKLPPIGGGSSDPLLGLQGTGLTMAGREVKFAAPAGKATLTAELDAELIDRQSLQGKVALSGSVGSNPGLALTQFQLTLTAPVEVVPPGTPLVKAIAPTDASRDAMAKALSIQSLTCTPGAGGSWIEYMFTATNCPHPAAFDVFLRWTSADGKAHEVPINGVVFRPGVGQSSYGGGADVKDQVPARVDVIFRPSLETAERTPDLSEYWDGEVMIPNVPVRTAPAEPDKSPAAGGGAGTGVGG